MHAQYRWDRGFRYRPLPLLCYKQTQALANTHNLDQKLAAAANVGADSDTPPTVNRHVMNDQGQSSHFRSKGRRALHWPITHSPSKSEIVSLVTQSSPSPPCFKNKHERSANSKEAIAESWIRCSASCQFCVPSLRAQP